MNSNLNQSTNAILGDVSISDRSVSRNGAIVFEFPTDIAEIARLEDKLFIVLSVPDPKADPQFAGTNLWCVSVDGKLLWKAQTLYNERDDQRFQSYLYSDLWIYDRHAPKLHCNTSERTSRTLDINTGTFFADSEPLDPTLPYNTRYALAGVQAKHREDLGFVASMKLRPVSKWVPVYEHPGWPPMVTSEPSP